MILEVIGMQHAWHCTHHYASCYQKREGEGVSLENAALNRDNERQCEPMVPYGLQLHNIVFKIPQLPQEAVMFSTLS